MAANSNEREDNVGWHRARITNGDIGITGMKVKNTVGADHFERSTWMLLPPAG
jgi:hypothetical protein